ncbi:MAG: hypothetical protein OXN89_19890 [Bryobacterales bacterium]|nr:hypothetical protein [Bryobacterales bacterium]
MQFLQSGATGDHGHDGNRKIPDVPLIRELSVHGDEDPESMVGRKAQQFPFQHPPQPVSCTVSVPNGSGNANASSGGMDP